MKILVSRCLLGEPCRYDGKSKPVEALLALERQGHILVPVCPEEDGGLPTPRPPAEIQEDGRVVNRAGIDVTAEYRAGAERALKLAFLVNVILFGIFNVFILNLVGLLSNIVVLVMLVIFLVKDHRARR